MFKPNTDQDPKLRQAEALEDLASNVGAIRNDLMKIASSLHSLSQSNHSIASSNKALAHQGGKL